MSYFFFSVPDNFAGAHSSIWHVSGDSALRVGVPNALELDSCHCTAKPGETTLEAICKLLNSMTTAGECTYWPTDLKPGEYYPRMARPHDQHLQESPGHNPGTPLASHAIAIAMALSQLNVLSRQLEQVCQTVHPSVETFDTYGHAIRNLLLLACTEVEMHWRGVLVANGLKKSRFSTGDYVQLQAAMRLGEYSINYPQYPWLDPITPFQGWDSKNPTQSLPWYDAYNAVKHNREIDFCRATLRHAFEAVTACVIMMISQFGSDFDGWRGSDAERFFKFISSPIWRASEVYILPYESLWKNRGVDAWTPVDFKFAE